MKKELASVLLIILTALLMSGCGNKVPFGGKVTFSDNGEPVPTGIIMFLTDTYQARGEIKEDGTYKLSSTGNDDGLPPGEYKVTIAAMTVDSPSEIITDGRNMPVSSGGGFIVDTKYANPNTSGLTATVNKSTKQKDFVVDRPSK